MLRLTALLLVVAGGIAVTLALGTPVRSGLSYLGGLGGALTVVAASSWLVAIAAARSPVMSLAVAMGCYLVTVLGFALALVVLDPTVVETRSLAAGLGAAVLLATVTAVSRATAEVQRRSGDGLGRAPVG